MIRVALPNEWCNDGYSEWIQSLFLAHPGSGEYDKPPPNRKHPLRFCTTELCILHHCILHHCILHRRTDVD